MADRMIEGWTLAEAEEMLAEYKAALKAIAGGKSYSMDDKSLTRADEQFIERQIKKFYRIVRRFQTGRKGGMRIMRVVPQDR